jgi:hypothetical protein
VAHFAFTNGYFSWNSVALSSHVRAINLRSSLSTVSDAGVMGSTAEKVIPVLEDYSLEVMLSQDFANSQVDITLAADKLAKTARAFEIRPDAGTVGANNPKYTGTGIITEYDPVYGSFGEVLGTRIVIRPTVAGLTRATA